MSHLAAGDGCNAPAEAVMKPNDAAGTAGGEFDFKFGTPCGVEDIKRYKPGGYHPIAVGDTLRDGRYRITDKFGHGTYSTSWIARDQETNKYVTIQIFTADSSGGSQERAVLHHLRDGSCHERANLVTALLDEFHLDGPNGRHSCMVTRPARISLQDARNATCWYGLLHVPTARAVMAQLIHAVAFCHKKGVVHGDLHLGNIMLHFPPDASINSLSTEQFYKRFGEPNGDPIKRLDGKPLGPGVPEKLMWGAWLGCASEKIQLADCAISLANFGKAYMVTPRCLSQEQQHRAPPSCHTPLLLRPPEARFAPSELGPASDIWTLACAIFEIASSHTLFTAWSSPIEDSVTEDWVDALGRLPDDWSARWDARVKRFPDDGQRPYHTYDDMRGPIEPRFERWSQELRRKEGMDEWDGEEVAALLGMLKAMLRYKPAERISVVEVLETEWMVRWGTPAMEEMKKAQEAAVNCK